jgi:hypothetical protein
MSAATGCFSVVTNSPSDGMRWTVLDSFVSRDSCVSRLPSGNSLSCVLLCVNLFEAGSIVQLLGVVLCVGTNQ